MLDLFWRRGSRPKVVLLIMALTYAAVSGIGEAWIVWTDYQETVIGAVRQTQTQAHLLQEHVGRTLGMAEAILARVPLSAMTSSPFLQTKAQREALTAIVAANPELDTLLLLDPSGSLIWASSERIPATLGERDWVRTLRTRPDFGTALGQMTFDGQDHAPVFTVGRAVLDASGGLVAMAALTIRVDHFLRSYEDGDFNRNHVLQLGVHGLNGNLLVHQPMPRTEKERDSDGIPVYITQLGDQTAGTIRGQTALDGQERLVSYRVLESRKLLVWVAHEESEALEIWLRRSIRVLAQGLIGLVVMAGLSALLLRELRRERKAARQLLAVNRDLQRSNTDLEQFAYIASHDLKEPLRSIASYVQLLQRRYQGRLDEDADAFIGFTVDGVTRMQAVINELLAYSRVGTGELTMVPVQSGVLVSSALAHLKSAIAEAQAVIEVQGTLPVVVADAALLASLFQNLISNAIKYRRPEMRPQVVIGCQDRGEEWAFYVRDNGIGIDPAYHQQIFELFKRLHTRDRYSGTGIGLTLCLRVVDRHGGRIWVDSLPGEGATFWFTLPKRPSPAQDGVAGTHRT